MPDAIVTDATRVGIRAVLADRGPRRQRLPGFDADYHDIVHYILRCTYRIWEQRRVDLILSHYDARARVITLGGASDTAQAVVDATRAVQRSFPDRRLRGEEVIWCRLPGSAGFFSSHRILSTMTHRAASEFGAADGAQARFRTIADCYVRANRIHLEWLTRDNFAIATQLGKDPQRLAASMARSEHPAFVQWRREAAQRILASGRMRAMQPWRGGRAGAAIANGSVSAPRHPQIPAHAARWTKAWLGAIAARDWYGLDQLYARRFRGDLPRGRYVRSATHMAAYWASMVSALPDLSVTPDRATCLAAGANALPLGTNALRIALRWWGAGTHRGGGRFGPPSGAPVLLLGISHFILEDGVVRREWTVLDELAVLRQIAHARPRSRR